MLKTAHGCFTRVPIITNCFLLLEGPQVSTSPDLLAAYWTLAGDVDPLRPSISPYSLQKRVEAASRAGWRGIGVIHEDLTATLEKIDVSTVKHIFDDNGIKHFELEFLVDWYRKGPEREVSDRARRVI